MKVDIAPATPAPPPAPEPSSPTPSPTPVAPTTEAPEEPSPEEPEEPEEPSPEEPEEPSPEEPGEPEEPPPEEPSPEEPPEEEPPAPTPAGPTPEPTTSPTPVAPTTLAPTTVAPTMPHTTVAPTQDDPSWKITHVGMFCKNRIKIGSYIQEARCVSAILANPRCANVMQRDHGSTACKCVPEGETCTLRPGGADISEIVPQAACSTYTTHPTCPAPRCAWTGTACVIPMTDFKMERFPREDPPTICRNATHGWGNFGKDMTDSECADACLRDPSCKFVGNYWFTWGKNGSPNGGRCTQYDTCTKETGKRFVPYFWEKVPAPAPVPLPPPREVILPGDQRRWDILPGEVKLTDTTTAPDNISAGLTDTPVPCFWTQKDKGKKCIKVAACGKTRRIPVEKHGDPKGVEWCAKRSNYDSMQDLCDQIKAKYDEVEQLEAKIYRAYTARSRFNYMYEHTTMFGRGAQQQWFLSCRTTNTECGEINEQLSKALAELAALNDKVVG